MSKLTLLDFGSDYQSKQNLNANNTAVRAAFDNTLSRDGTSPNAMAADFDMNSHRILNLPAPVAPTDPVRLEDVTTPLNITVLSTAYPVPETYGAVGNAVVADDGAITTGTKAFSSASLSFSSADVGKTIAIMGAGAAGVTLITTIASITSLHVIQIAVNASTTVTGAHFVYGTDDSTALNSLFAAGNNQVGLSPNKAYLTTTKLTVKCKLFEGNKAPIFFAIGNNTDNCFSIQPQTPLIVTQTESRYTYNNLVLDGMATGLDLLYADDGSPNIKGLILNNSYRDALQLNPHYSPNTAIENLVGLDWYMGKCGRHAAHLNLVGGNSTTIQVYINESVIFGWEIRGIGRRFGTGTGGSRANAIRITYDGIDIALLSANKVSCFKIWGANWDCEAQSSLGGNAPGDVIYHNCINGTTGRQVEMFRVEAGGIENTGGIVPPNTPLLITGNAMVAGDWIESSFDAIYYQWAFGPDPVFLATPADGNEFWNTTGSFGTGGHAKTYLPFQKRPGAGTYAGYSMISTDVAPNGGIIDPNFKNVMTPWLGKITLVAGGNATVDIPIDPLPVAGIGVQWPVKVMVSINPYGDSTPYWAYGEYTVLMVYEVTGDTTHITSIVGTTKIPGDPTISFTPTTDVSFSIVSSSGTLRDRLRVTILGGANVGTAGALTQVQVMASRWGMGLSQIQRTDKIGNPSQEYSFTI